MGKAEESEEEELTALRSPLELYCEQLDAKYPDQSYMWMYYNVALTVDRKYFTNLFLEDLKFRASHQRNFVGSVEGQQGCGKSLFSCALGEIEGKLYHNIFDYEKDIYANPSELDYQLRHGNNRRRTFLYDEQPQRNVGIGSSTTQISLKDYEEICRYTQNNLIYCSPEIEDHAHYFIFRQVDFDPPRKKNAVCRKCPKYVECQKSFYSTLCHIPFYERDGYPTRFNFLLETKRLSDRIFVPRGIVSLPMIAPEKALLYNKVKGRNIQQFEQQVNNSWKRKMQELEKFVNDNMKELIVYRGKAYKPVSKKVIEGFFYDAFTTAKFTKGEVEIFVELIRHKLFHETERLNNEEEH